jgi:hypothetical protein
MSAAAKLRILDAFGMFDFDRSYDYKSERQERSLGGTVGGKVRPSKNL